MPSTAVLPVRPSRRRGAVLAGLLVAVLVGLAGAVFWIERPVEYRATTTLVVLPASGADEAASYYDTLSRGQVTTTFAEILAVRADPEEIAPGTAVTVEVVPDTSLIQLAVTGPDEAAAEAAADAALGQVAPYFDQLGAPYVVTVVAEAAGAADAVGFTPLVLAAVITGVALVAGVAVYMGVRALQEARRQALGLRSRPQVPGGLEASGLSAALVTRTGGGDESPDPAQEGAGSVPSYSLR